MSIRPLALVTGGCHRLGGAIAGRLARAGWDLALHAHAHREPEPNLATVLDAAGAAWTVTAADFADPAAAQALVPRVAAEWSRAPRLLVNSAARFGDDTLATTTAEALIGHYAVNCASPALLTAAFAALAADSAEDADRVVINILDQRVEQPHGDQLAYTLSKMALAGLTRIAAIELAPAVRVNAVAPGLTIATDDYDAALIDKLTRMMPLARLPSPEDIADAVLFLTEARATTGQVLFVDGGARLRSWDKDFVNL